MAKGRVIVLVTGFVALLVLLLVGGLLVLRSFFQPFEAASANMEPTISTGDRIFVNTHAAAQRGDIVVYEGSAVEDGEDGARVGRVVAIGGDAVRFDAGQLVVNDLPVNEPYVVQPDPAQSNLGQITLETGTVYVLGDNRANSRDSRFFGPVPESAIVGVRS